MSTLAVYDCMLFFMRAARPDRNRETFDLVDRGLVTYCLSRDVITEIYDVLTRPRHQRDFPELRSMSVDAYLNEITRHSQFIAEVPEVYVVARDPKDSKYINLAVAAGARFLVTRDKDLLDLMDQNNAVGADFFRRFPNLKILEPRDFVKLRENSGVETKRPPLGS